MEEHCHREVSNDREHSERRRAQSRRFSLHHSLVHVTPPPVLSRFERTHYGMLGLVIMPGGVFSGRTIAAADVPADQTLAQLHPRAAAFQTFFAAVTRRLNFTNLRDVLARLRFHFLQDRRLCSTDAQERWIAESHFGMYAAASRVRPAYLDSGRTRCKDRRICVSHTHDRRQTLRRRSLD